MSRRFNVNVHDYAYESKLPPVSSAKLRHKTNVGGKKVNTLAAMYGRSESEILKRARDRDIGREEGAWLYGAVKYATDDNEGHLPLAKKRKLTHQAMSSAATSGSSSRHPSFIQSPQAAVKLIYVKVPSTITDVEVLEICGLAPESSRNVSSLYLQPIEGPLCLL